MPQNEFELVVPSDHSFGNPAILNTQDPLALPRSDLVDRDPSTRRAERMSPDCSEFAPRSLRGPALRGLVRECQWLSGSCKIRKAV